MIVDASTYLMTPGAVAAMLGLRGLALARKGEP
jgi:hypothetical protein